MKFRLVPIVLSFRWGSFILQSSFPYFCILLSSYPEQKQTSAADFVGHAKLIIIIYFDILTLKANTHWRNRMLENPMCSRESGYRFSDDLPLIRLDSYMLLLLLQRLLLRKAFINSFDNIFRNGLTGLTPREGKKMRTRHIYKYQGHRSNNANCLLSGCNQNHTT